MFIKHGDGKIVTVIKPEELTEEQKEFAKKKAKEEQDKKKD